MRRGLIVLVLGLLAGACAATQSAKSPHRSTSTTSATRVALVSRDPVPCGLIAAAESCWAAHTGVTGSTGYTEAQIEAGKGGFRHIVGDLTLTTPNTVIDRAWISGCVAVDAPNVTIKDSLITTRDRCHGGNQSALGGAVNDGGVGPNELHANMLVEDTEVDGENVSVDTTGVGAVSFACIRCNVHGFTHDVAPGDHGVVYDSYLHSLTTGSAGSHEETIYADSATDFSAEHNFLRSSAGNGFVAGAIFVGNTYGPATGIAIHGNYLEGDQGSDLVVGCSNADVRITGNALSKAASGYGYVAGPGATGFWARAGNWWARNYDSRSGAAVSQAGDSTCR